MTEESKIRWKYVVPPAEHSAEFDIIHQIYQCRYCGQKVDANEPVERLKNGGHLKGAIPG